MACIAAKPIVDGIESKHQGNLDVIRLNIQEPETQPVAESLGFQYTPTFIFFSAEGEELWRSVGSIDPQEVDQSLTTH